jgi:26S proteasome regulatory subunit N2
LGEYDEALSFALSAGSLLSLYESSIYVHVIKTQCIDRYIKLRQEGNSESALDSRLTLMIESLFELCFENCQYKQAIGIALESHRLDICSRVIDASPDRLDMLRYLQGAASTIVPLDIRQQVSNVVSLCSME